jgi:hypothetical protein
MIYKLFFIIKVVMSVKLKLTENFKSIWLIPKPQGQ